MTPDIQQAVILLSQETIEDINKKQNEAKKQQELALMGESGKLVFPSPPSNNISRFLS